VDGVANNTKVLAGLEDVVSGKKFKAALTSPKVTYKDQVYYFESAETKAAFEKEPEKYAVVYGK
jgi:YHS domain-containing protein